MKVVLDTNVLLSGLMLPASLPGRILAAWRKAAFDLVVSEPLIAELGRALRYPKIRTRLHWDERRIRLFLDLFRFQAVVVDISTTRASVPGNPADNHVRAALIASKADCLVTGDGALIALQGRYPIVTPREFAERL
ncbi:MAG: putative toxin-antitoxin system toxin component, PIN family [Nitrospinae bacterium]|nr:putative toxin-antitoxin system toxin component, PIN family [Nitrospinota bacterium]